MGWSFYGYVFLLFVQTVKIRVWAGTNPAHFIRNALLPNSLTFGFPIYFP
jgi:hypothetical protein